VVTLARRGVLFDQGMTWGLFTARLLRSSPTGPRSQREMASRTQPWQAAQFFCFCEDRGNYTERTVL